MNDDEQDSRSLKALRIGLVAAMLLYLVLAIGTTCVMRGETPPYDYCVDHVYYTRACEASPFSVAAGSPGYAGQICSAHTYAWRGEDLFTYPIADQNFLVPYQGTKYPRPPASAGAQAQAVWDSCWVAHLPLGAGYPCTLSPVGGTLNYLKRTWAQLPEGPQKIAWGHLYHCTVATETPTPVPPTPTGVPACPTQTPCQCLTPTAVPRTATRTNTTVPKTPVPSATPHLGPAPTKSVAQGGWQKVTGYFPGTPVTTSTPTEHGVVTMYHYDEWTTISVGGEDCKAVALVRGDLGFLKIKCALTR